MPSCLSTDLGQSYGPDNYTAFTCYDFVQTSQPSTLVEYGTYASTSSSSPTNIAIASGKTSLSYAYTSGVSPIQAGALLSFNSSTVTARFGISLISATQACSNAEEEVPDWSWDRVQEASRSKWEEMLSRIIVDTDREDSNVVKLLYSSVMRLLLCAKWQLIVFCSYIGYLWYPPTQPVKIRTGNLLTLSLMPSSGT